MAHGIHVFAHAHDCTIHGEASFDDEAPVKNARVVFSAPSGEKLGETTTDDEGRFQFDARVRADHLIVVDAGAGHQGRHTLKAAELPDDLPLPGGRVADAAAESASADERAEPTTPEERRLRALIKSAVQEQIVPLREQIDRFQRKTRVHDVVGGVGYILGIMGLAYYFLGRSRRPRD
jgi:nickel transport protein